MIHHSGFFLLAVIADYFCNTEEIILTRLLVILIFALDTDLGRRGYLDNNKTNQEGENGKP
jgi:hypothetical protein